MSDSPGRLLRMLSLLQTPRSWPGSDLAKRLEVSARTIRRDIDRLRELGYPVEATMGTSGGYRLRAGAEMPPLLLEDDEAVAIAVGLRLPSGRAVAGIEDASVRALGKVLQVLPKRLRAQVDAVGRATDTLVIGDDDGTRVDPEMLTVIAEATVNEQRLRFDYRTRERVEAERRADPSGLVAAFGRWYLVAFDVDRDDWRTYRVDRMGHPRPAGGRDPSRELPAANPAAFLADRLLELAPTFRADVTLDLAASEGHERFGDRFEVAPVGRHRCRIRTQVDTIEWLAFWLIRLDCDYEVHEPPQLIERLRTIGERAGRATERST